MSIGVSSANRKRPIHRWYPFIEGYSSELVERAIDAGSGVRRIFDPFGGSGTTALTAATLGHASTFTEVNPYLSWLADVKVNKSRQGSANAPQLARLAEFATGVAHKAPPRPRLKAHPLIQVDRARKFFPPGVARQVVDLLQQIDNEFDGWCRDLARLAVATSLIPASNMIRRTDLRHRTSTDPSPMPLRTLVSTQLSMIVHDTKEFASQVLNGASQLGFDARGPYKKHEPFDLVVTSPPYLNGTNYCRNSKLELLALRFIQSETDLDEIRRTSVTAGINNVSKRLRPARPLPEVDVVADRVAATAYDPRIASMIRSYFSDMAIVLKQLHRASRTGAELWLDIGDSRYAGVDVPTHTLLGTIAESVGWRPVATEVLRTRRSYDGSPLTQDLLRFVAV